MQVTFVVTAAPSHNSQNVETTQMSVKDPGGKPRMGSSSKWLPSECFRQHWKRKWKWESSYLNISAVRRFWICWMFKVPSLKLWVLEWVLWAILFSATRCGANTPLPENFLQKISSLNQCPTFLYLWWGEVKTDYFQRLINSAFGLIQGFSTSESQTLWLDNFFHCGFYPILCMMFSSILGTGLVVNTLPFPSWQAKPSPDIFTAAYLGMLMAKSLQVKNHWPCPLATQSVDHGQLA